MQWYLIIFVSLKTNDVLLSLFAIPVYSLMKGLFRSFVYFLKLNYWVLSFIFAYLTAYQDHKLYEEKYPVYTLFTFIFPCLGHRTH